MKRCAAVLVCALFLTLAGCDDGGDDGDADLLATPDYDLTGCWEISELPLCDGTVVPREDPGVLGVDYFEGLDEALDELETDRVDDTPTRVRQDGNDLEITETSSGLQAVGTIVGDQVRHRSHEEVFGVEIEVEGRGGLASYRPSASPGRSSRASSNRVTVPADEPRTGRAPQFCTAARRA